MEVVIEGVNLPGRRCALGRLRHSVRWTFDLDDRDTDYRSWGTVGGDGGPRCAAVRPPGIEWSAD